ncbi:MAG: hypothetical protein MR902_07045 [Campylobacter sp.]|nr:hypothetical protein [Campylobacter sp.]
MKIISFLRTVENESFLSPCKYKAGGFDFLKDGDFITSSDAIFMQNQGAKFLFLGGKTEIKNVTNRFSDENTLNNEIANKNIKTLEINDDYRQIFSMILDEISVANEQIIIDITHRDRDVSFIAPFATMLSKLGGENNVKIIYAKIIKSEKKKTFEFVSLDEFAKIMQISFILISFKQFIKVPQMALNSEIYIKLSEFSNAFLSNQIYKCIEIYPFLKEILEHEKENELEFLKDFINEILAEISFFDGLDKKQNYEIYFVVAKFLYQKEYYLNSSQFLIEGVIRYLFEKMNEKQLIKNDNNTHISIDNLDVYELCSNFLSSSGQSVHKNYHFTHQNQFFLDLNCEKFELLRTLKDKIGSIRNDLTHINKNTTKNIDEKLKKCIEEFEAVIINKNILSDLDFSEANIHKLTAYHKKNFVSEIKDKASVKNLRQMGDDKIIERLIEYYDEGGKFLKSDETRNELAEIFRSNSNSKLLYKNIKNKTKYFDESLK